MSASEDLQSAVQPAASEALEGFPLSPLQTRAWRRHAERPENTVVGVRLHAPADPVATLERLRRALDGEAQLRVAYRTMPGMSLPVQVLDGRAADLLVERLPGDGDWAGRFARESARLAASPLGGEGQPVLALGLLLDAAGETLQGLLLAAPAFVVDAASLVALLRRGLGPAGQASADEGDEALLFQHFSEWANEALAGEDGESASGYWREQAAVAAESPLALADDLGEGEWTARRLLPRALLERLAANGLPEAAALLAWTQVAGQFQGDEGLPLEMARLVSGACSTSSPSWPDRSPGSRRCAWRMSARAASASGSTPSRRRSSPRRRQRPCAIPLPPTGRSPSWASPGWRANWMAPGWPSWIAVSRRWAGSSSCRCCPTAKAGWPACGSAATMTERWPGACSTPGSNAWKASPPTGNCHWPGCR